MPVVNAPIAAILIPPIITMLIGAAIAWLAKPHPLRGRTLLIGKRPSSGRALIRAIQPIRGVYTWKEKGDFKADLDLDSAFLWDERSLGVKMVEVDLDVMQPIKYEGKAKALIAAGKLAGGPEMEKLGLSRRVVRKLRKPAPDTSAAQDLAALNAEGDTTAIQMQLANDGVLYVGDAEPIRYEGVCINDGESVTVDYLGEKRKVKSVWKRLPGTRQYLIRKDTRLKQLASIGGSFWEFMTKVAPILMVVGLLISLATLAIVLKVAL
jgi:hypothetical protein